MTAGEAVEAVDGKCEWVRLGQDWQMPLPLLKLRLQVKNKAEEKKN